MIFGCLRTKKSPFDFSTGSGFIGSISFSNSISTSNAKDITEFSIVSPLATGTISDSSINVSVPVGTDLTNLVAQFQTTGQSVKIGATTQTSGVTVNDFINPVVYTVVAADSTTNDYTVTVVESGQTSAPSFNIPTGTYNADLAITISTTTVGAVIYFNRSTGSTPTDPDCTGSGTLYSNPITVDSTGTIIKAIACKSGLAASAIISATYTLKVAATYPISTGELDKLVVPFTFTANTSSTVAINKCLRYTLPPSCNPDGTCATGTTNLFYNSITTNVTVMAIGCRLNYLPSDVQSKTYTLSAIRSTDNTYLTIVDPDAGAIINKHTYVCSEGETFNATTNTCDGISTSFQYCASSDNSCNGGLDSGVANNASPIFTYCNSLNRGSLGSGWRVPTKDELTGFFVIFAKSPNGFPVTDGIELWSNQSVLSGFANTISNTGAYQTNINQIQKTLTRNLRCIHD